MFSYETAGSDGSFIYKVQYSRQTAGWSLDSMQIFRGDALAFSVHPGGIYRTESLAIAYGINRCEAIVANFTLGALNWNDDHQSHGQPP